LGWSGVGSFAQQPGPVADGFLVYLNNYDGQIYCIGKGPSITTVEAPLSNVVVGSVITIKGTVSDQSAGAKAKVDSGEFSVVAAVSDESIAGYMEYVYMQKPLPAELKGVNVVLTATNTNGQTTTIGNAITDINGKYALSWTPTTQGTYHIKASFQTTNSYWSSQDTTYITVGPTTNTNTGSASLAEADSAILIGVAVVALIIAIAAVALVIRKRN
jgi:hypothetical protein